MRDGRGEHQSGPYNERVMEADTIVAMVTPPGEGGVSIVRASGPEADGLARRLFPDLRPPWRSHRMRQGRLADPETGETVDGAMGVLMRGPRSYTGEDVFEIHLHGNPLLVERTLRICFAQGCRPARPGEFTLRAFLAGRLDLSQAEAVLDVVRARTNTGLDLAMRQLSGWLTVRIAPLRDLLMGTLAHMEAMVDFVEEDIPPEVDGRTRGTLQAVREAVGRLHAGMEGGIIVREGATLCLVGSPNVGKSSLMNALLGMERSIVTPLPGTTRDTVEEMVAIRGVPFRMIDTAGITDTEDVVEGLGIERSKRSMRAADVVLLVLDRSRPPDERDALTVCAVREAWAGAEEEGRPFRLVVTWNKADLPPAGGDEILSDDLHPLRVVQSSALQAEGIDDLQAALADAALGGNRAEIVSGNARHAEALRQADDALRTALAGLESGVPLDLISFDVRAAAVALGEITGANVDDELLDRIFRDFCIGK